MADDQNTTDLPVPSPDLHSSTDADAPPFNVDVPPTKENPGWSGAPQDLIGCTITVKGSKTAAGLVTGWAHVPDKGLVVVADGKQYLAADITIVQPQQG